MKPGELYKFPEGAGHCRHGLLMVHDTQLGPVLCDTYWGYPSENTTFWKPEQLAGRVSLILDLSAARQVSKREFEQYRECDRAWIPVGGGPEQFWVRKDATPDPRLVEEQLRGEIWDAEQDLTAAAHRVKYLSIMLGELLAGGAR